MAIERKKIIIKFAQDDISRQALLDAGYDPARFGKRQRSTVEVNRKKASKRGYQKHKNGEDGRECSDSRQRPR